MKLMDISQDLADLNQQRYRDFPGKLKESNAHPAILQFQGDVFQGLQLDSYGSKEYNHLSKHLGILSGMYGILSPFDLMHPYRLEMGTRIKVGDKKNLYQYWGNRITDELNKRMSAVKAKHLLNLASDEYAKSVVLSEIQGTIVTVDFREYRSAKWKVVSYNAKRARGAMLDWVIRHRPGSVGALKKFNEGYEFVEETADAAGVHRLLFHKQDD